MSVIEQLQPASFRGIPFLVNAETKTGGKKTVTHEYVGSDKRFTEDDLGLLPPSFSIEAVIHGPDAIFIRFQLERVLDESGLGELVHPVYGSIKVKSTTYSVNSNQTKIGEFRFSINFETSEATITPSVGPFRPGAITDFADSTRTALDNALEEAFVGPLSPGYTPDVLSDTAEKIIEAVEPTFIDQVVVGDNSMYDTVFDFSTKTVGAVRSRVATFTRFVSSARADMLTIVQQPFEVKNNIKAFYQEALNIVNTPRDLSDTWERLLDFGFAQVPPAINTIIRRNTENNKSVLDEHTRLTALTNLYEASADQNYTTESEINDQKKVLDDGYNRLMESFGNDIDLDNFPSLAMDADFKAAMTDLRTNTGKVLDQKAQNAFKVVTINPGKSSMALTAYRYYGDHENLDELQDLNPGISWSNFDDNIQAVSG